MARTDAPPRSAPGVRVRLRQVVDVVAAAPYLLVTPFRREWARTWGATADEVAAPMAGDDLVPFERRWWRGFEATRALTIGAQPADVWPWMVQVGSSATGRAGFYSLDLVDNLGTPSADVVLPQWQQPRVGDLAAPMLPRPSERTSYRVALVDEHRTLVWANPDGTWAWRLTPLPDGSTRLVTRFRQRYRARPSAVAIMAAMELGDFAMMRVMLLGVKRRAERLARAHGR